MQKEVILKERKGYEGIGFFIDMQSIVLGLGHGQFLILNRINKKREAYTLIYSRYYKQSSTYY